jgi:3',5'-cyclic AMP phosphodiesterase CpdA
LPLTIVQLSDIHCGSPLFDPMLLRAAVDETLRLQPDLVVIAGDLTQEGYPDEFQMARDGLRAIVDELPTLVIPGNHDAKNVGMVHFEDHFGKGEVEGRADRSMMLRHPSPPGTTQLVAIDSSKPDLAEGEIGTIRYGWIRSRFEAASDFKVFVLHHHLLPIPGTGRERNIVWDAGDVLQLLEESRVDLVLCGHKHVPHAWALGRMLVVNSGTVSSYRTRGYTRPSYNVLRIDEERIDVSLIYPGAGARGAARFDRATGALVRNPELADMLSKDGWGW